jgi:hypothetical protein
LLGLLAQLDLPAPQMTVTLQGDHMAVEMHVAPFGDQPLVILAQGRPSERHRSCHSERANDLKATS